MKYATPLDGLQPDQHPFGKVSKKVIARINGVSVRTIDNWMEKGIVPFTKIGGLVRFNPAQVDAALRQFEVNGR
jgi:excisionase family DNA binding protein